MSYNPTVDYRSDRPALSQETQIEPRSWITQVAIWGALSICVAVWAIVGFLLWFPLLLRQIVAFVVSLTYATLTGGDMDDAAGRLRGAATFYRRGFESAVESVLSGSREAMDSESSVRRSHSARPILSEVAWALVVWYPALLWLGIAELTPADVWSSIAGLPWSEVATDVVATVAAVIEEWASALGL
ncbi:MAG: hypothetical protein ACOC5J_03495 [Gemmatimonadota bacterium]